MNNFFKFLSSGIIILILPVLCWDVWFLNYIDSTGKLIPFLLAPVFAFIGTIIITGVSTIKYSIKINGYWNPFYGWFFLSLIINLLIVLLSNS